MVSEGQDALDVRLRDSSLLPLQLRQGQVVTQTVPWLSIAAIPQGYWSFSRFFFNDFADRHEDLVLCCPLPNQRAIKPSVPIGIGRGSERVIGAERVVVMLRSPPITKLPH